MNPLDEDIERITEDARTKITNVPVRQSALDKAKAEARAKKLRDEREAASALEDFVKEFDADVSDDRDWRTGGTEGGMPHSPSAGPGGRVAMGGGGRRHFTTAPKDVYPINEGLMKDDDYSSRAAGSGKKRNLDSFLEELKRDQSIRDSSRDSRHERTHPSRDRPKYDAANTLHIACLPLFTRESQLRELLSPYGNITHLRITQETPSSKEFVRRSASAIVVFQKSSQAEKAHAAMDGHYISAGYRIQASWGDHEVKPKDIPSAPFNARVDTQSLTTAQLSRAPPPTSLLVPSNVPKWGQKQRLVIRVQRPTDARTLRRIHAVIEGIFEYGPDFEALLMEREKDNENYAFLFDSNLPEAQYYRWKAYSLKSGDTPYSWQTEPFQMFIDGEWWIPPDPMTDIEPIENEEESHIPRVKGFLGQNGQRKLLWLLRSVDVRRGSIARAMAFAMQHADAAEEIVDIIIASLCSRDASIPKKIARLYLVNDILHNSSSGRSNVWKYRQLFESRLPPVFAHLHSIYASFDGRIKADAFRRQVMSVTSIWEKWMIFNNANVEAWNKTFLGRNEVEQSGEGEIEEDEVVEKPVEKKGKWKSMLETSGKESSVVSNIDEQEDVDGEEFDEDVDGQAMEEEEDVDGEVMDEDIDGEPMEEEDADGQLTEEQPAEESSVPSPLPETEPLPEPVLSRREPSPEKKPAEERPRPVKRQRMKAADMFND